MIDWFHNLVVVAEIVMENARWWIIGQPMAAMKFVTGNHVNSVSKHPFYSFYKSATVFFGLSPFFKVMAVSRSIDMDCYIMNWLYLYIMNATQNLTSYSNQVLYNYEQACYYQTLDPLVTSLKFYLYISIYLFFYIYVYI